MSNWDKTMAAKCEAMFGKSRGQRIRDLIVGIALTTVFVGAPLIILAALVKLAWRFLFA